MILVMQYQPFRGGNFKDFFFSLEKMFTGAQYNAAKNTGVWFTTYIPKISRLQ